MSKVHEHFGKLPQLFLPAEAQGLNAIYQFNITGEEGGQWFARIEEGELEVVEGEHEGADVTLTLHADDYMKMVAGTLAGHLALISGKIKFKGNFALLIKLAKIFPQNQAPAKE